MDILSFLFPKRCIGCGKSGPLLCDECFTYLNFDVHFNCGVCLRPTLSGLTHPVCRNRYTIDGIFPALVYNPIAKKLIRQFKSSPYLSSLKTILAKLTYEGLIQQEAFMKTLTKSAILIPIPLHNSRLKQRGYNQAYLLADELSRLFPLSLQDCLKREAIKGAFKLKEGVNLKRRIVFLVDDTVNSGITLNEAAQVLKKAGVEKVYGIAFAQGN